MSLALQIASTRYATQLMYSLYKYREYFCFLIPLKALLAIPIVIKRKSGISPETISTTSSSLVNRCIIADLHIIDGVIISTNSMLYMSRRAMLSDRLAAIGFWLPINLPSIQVAFPVSVCRVRVIQMTEPSGRLMKTHVPTAKGKLM
jgi:hypothetical protein